MSTLFSTLANGETGSSVRTKLNAAINNANRLPVYLYVTNSSAQSDSLCHAATGVFLVGDVVLALHFDSNLDAESGGLLKVVSVLGSPYGGTLGTFTNGGATGPIIEGLNYRFALIPSEGGRLDLKRCGIRCVEGVTGWHSRFAEVCAYAKNQAQRITLTGSGVLSCTETVYLDRVCIDFGLLRFQGGTHVSTGATVGSPTFFTAGQTNTAVTITPGTPVAVTHTAHGFSDNQQIMLGTEPGRLPGGLSILTTYFVKVVDANTYNLATSSGGAAINSATAGWGTHYAFYSTSGQALPAQSGITTQDILLPNGKIKRLGVVVRAGTNGSNKDYIRSFINVWGDGNSDWTTPPSTLNVRHEADDSPNGSYEYVVNYHYMGVAIQGPAEKHSLTIRSTLGGILAGTVNGSSADTIRTHLHASNQLMWWYEHHGISTSPDIIFACESRDDPDARTNWEGGNSAPAILIRTGKLTTLEGKIRAQNGLVQIKICGNINSAGTSVRFGADTVIFKDLTMIDGDGMALLAQQVRYISGNLHIKEWANYDGVNAQNSPMIVLGRISNAGGFYVDAVGVTSMEGVNVGGSFADGYYSKQAHLGHYAISMGSLLQFNPDSNDGTKGTERSGSSAHPTTLLGANIEKWDDCVIDLTGQRGNTTLGAACEGGVLMVDPLAKLYTIDDSSSPATSIGYPTLSTSGLTII